MRRSTESMFPDDLKTSEWGMECVWRGSVRANSAHPRMAPGSPPPNGQSWLSQVAKGLVTRGTRHMWLLPWRDITRVASHWSLTLPSTLCRSLLPGGSPTTGDPALGLQAQVVQGLWLLAWGLLTRGLLALGL